MNIDQAGTLSKIQRAFKQRRVLARKLATKIEARALGRVLSPFRKGNIAMFHIGRSGSTVLADLLGQHPLVYWDGEIYEQLFQRMEKSNGNPVQGKVEVDPVRLLQEKMVSGGRKFYGFEVKFFHLEMTGIGLEDYMRRLDELGYSHYIVLERKNYLRKIASSVVAHKKARYHQSNEKKAVLSQVRMEVDPLHIDRTSGSLLSFLEGYEQSFARLKQLLEGHKLLWLTYEDDILQDPRVGYRRTCEFLGLKPQEVTVRYGKTNPFPLADMLENFSEVEQALCGTPYEWMLYD